MFGFFKLNSLVMVTPSVLCLTLSPSGHFWFPCSCRVSVYHPAMPHSVHYRSQQSCCSPVTCSIEAPSPHSFLARLLYLSRSLGSSHSCSCARFVLIFLSQPHARLLQTRPDCSLSGIVLLFWSRYRPAFLDLRCTDCPFGFITGTDSPSPVSQDLVLWISPSSLTLWSHSPRICLAAPGHRVRWRHPVLSGGPHPSCLQRWPSRPPAREDLSPQLDPDLSSSCKPNEIKTVLNFTRVSDIESKNPDRWHPYSIF